MVLGSFLLCGLCGFARAENFVRVLTDERMIGLNVFSRRGAEAPRRLFLHPRSLGYQLLISILPPTSAETRPLRLSASAGKSLFIIREIRCQSISMAISISMWRGTAAPLRENKNRRKIFPGDCLPHLRQISNFNKHLFRSARRAGCG